MVELTILTTGWRCSASNRRCPVIRRPDGPSRRCTESYGLNEFIITDFPFREAQHVLNWTVEKLRDGGTMADLVDDNVLWRPVHDDHLSTDLFNQYHEYYGEWPRPGQMIQLFPSTKSTCGACVQDACVDLSDPAARIDQNLL